MKPVSDKILPPRRGTTVSLAGALASVCLVLFAVLGGCSSSTDPDDDTDPKTTISFTPSGQGQSLRLSETMDFSVSVEPVGDISVRWYRKGEVVGQDPAYTFIPAAVGKDTLGVSAFAGAEQDTYYWVITVEEDVSAIPPEVPDVLAEAGPDPADVVVTWKWVTGATFPLVEYQVAVSYEGAVNEANWDQATVIGRYPPVPGRVGYTETFTEAQDGMRPGEHAWFAVRVLDDRQQLSDLTRSSHLEITWPWNLEGYVTDDAGVPLLGAILSVDGISLGNTDGSGYFKLAKDFRNIDSIRVRADHPGATGFGYTTDPISVVDEVTRFDITLINDYSLDAACTYPDYLAYLRSMTWNDEVAGQPDHSRLFKWENYPVTVYIPTQLNLAGVEMEPGCAAALDFWNTQMEFDATGLGIQETDYFVRTSDEVAADIVFLFEERVLNYGQVTLLLPGPDEELGDVIPEKMQIWINTTAVLDSLDIAGVALHEFGHTLGLFGHSDCSIASEHLMLPAGGVGSLNRLVPIHLDERRAARANRNIPQGANMTDFHDGKFH